jgi:hypothetical protein
MVVAENITVNAICPNIVQTNISSGTFYQSVAEKDLLTPVETLLEQFDALMGINQRTGLTVECGPRGVSFRESPEYLDVESKECCEMLGQRGALLYGLKQ